MERASEIRQPEADEEIDLLRGKRGENVNGLFQLLYTMRVPAPTQVAVDRAYNGVTSGCFQTGLTHPDNHVFQLVAGRLLTWQPL
jgi:hypothetical protein